MDDWPTVRSLGMLGAITYEKRTGLPWEGSTVQAISRFCLSVRTLHYGNTGGKLGYIIPLAADFRYDGSKVIQKTSVEFSPELGTPLNLQAAFEAPAWTQH